MDEMELEGQFQEEATETHVEQPQDEAPQYATKADLDEIKGLLQSLSTTQRQPQSEEDESWEQTFTKTVKSDVLKEISGYLSQTMAPMVRQQAAQTIAGDLGAEAVNIAQQMLSEYDAATIQTIAADERTKSLIRDAAAYRASQKTTRSAPRSEGAYTGDNVGMSADVLRDYNAARAAFADLPGFNEKDFKKAFLGGLNNG